MKYVSTSLLLALVLSSQAQPIIPNADLEAWSIPNTWTYTPDDWTTGNNQLLEHVVRDSMACEGNLAMRVYPIPGFETWEGVAWTEFDATYIPANLSFCVKANIVEVDTVKVRLTFWNDGGDTPLLAYEKIWMTTQSIENWSTINVPLDQIEPIMHFARLEVIAGYTTALGGGSPDTSISVDDFSFTVAESVEENECRFSASYAQGWLQVNQPDCGSDKMPLVRLYDLRGNLVIEKRGSTINLSQLSTGLYLVAIGGNNSPIYTQKLFIP
jgi:hypothetical protein